MKRPILLLILAMCATRTAFALTCGGFSIVPADHVLVKYSVALPAGATRSTPVVWIFGHSIPVTRTVSGGSATDVSCVEDTIDLGTLGAGRYDVTWTDSVNLGSHDSTFTFFVGAPVAGNRYNISVLPPLLPDSPVRLPVFTCSPNPAVAYLSDNDIHVSQYGASTPSCRNSVLDLGILPAGTYNVTARLDSGGPGSVTEFGFVVQQPAASSACSGAVTVTQTPDGHARLHFEDNYRGYAPVFGPPSVTRLMQAFVWDEPYWEPYTEIEQRVDDTANSAAPGAAPSSTICHAEELDLGPAREGYNQVWWVYRPVVNGADGGSLPSVEFTFLWQDGGVQCTTSPQLVTPSVAIEGVPFDVAMKVITLDPESGKDVSVSGQTVTVDLYTDSVPGPVYATPRCKTYTATVKPVPAGEYTLVWRINGGRSGTVTSHLTVAKPARIRAARH